MLHDCWVAPTSAKDSIKNEAVIMRSLVEAIVIVHSEPTRAKTPTIHTTPSTSWRCYRLRFLHISDGSFIEVYWASNRCRGKGMYKCHPGTSYLCQLTNCCIATYQPQCTVQCHFVYITAFAGCPKLAATSSGSVGRATTDFHSFRKVTFAFLKRTGKGK